MYSTSLDCPRAHAQVYHLDKDEWRGTGKVSLKFNDNLGVPHVPSNPPTCLQPAISTLSNWLHSPILSTLASTIRPCTSRPLQTTSLHPADLANISQTADFFGVDPHTARYITPPTASVDSIAECTAPHARSIHIV